MEKIMITRASMPSLDEYVEEIRELWNSHLLTNMGKKHNEFEAELCRFLDVSCISLFTNGHMALELAVQALGLKGEVITTPFTFTSTTHAIVRNGLTPVFCDIRPDDYTIDADKIEELITEKTTAILPVHVYGHMCDVEKIQHIADRYHLKVIYDAAHSFGVRFGEKPVGSFGDVSMFSFHATKVFNSIEGGAIVYHDPAIGEALKDLKNFGIHGETAIGSVGANAKMNEFQAAMGLCNLRHVKEDIASRKILYERYLDKLAGIDGIIMSQVSQKMDYNYAYFPILIKPSSFGHTRDYVYDSLRENQIYSRKYFYPLTNTLDCYKNLFQTQKTPVAEYVSDRILTLPIYPGLCIDEVDNICSQIKQMN